MGWTGLYLAMPMISLFVGSALGESRSSTRRRIAWPRRPSRDPEVTAGRVLKTCGNRRPWSTGAAHHHYTQLSLNFSFSKKKKKIKQSSKSYFHSNHPTHEDPFLFLSARSSEFTRDPGINFTTMSIIEIFVKINK